MKANKFILAACLFAISAIQAQVAQDLSKNVNQESFLEKLVDLYAGNANSQNGHIEPDLSNSSLSKTSTAANQNEDVIEKLFNLYEKEKAQNKNSDNKSIIGRLKDLFSSAASSDTTPTKSTQASQASQESILDKALEKIKENVNSQEITQNILKSLGLANNITAPNNSATAN